MPFDRSAFTYMEPRKGSYGDKQWFAQCGTCMMWVSDPKLCMIHGPNVKATADTTCTLYVNGKPHEKGKAIKFVTPKESGAYKGRVQCHRCRFYRGGDSKCLLFVWMNKGMQGEAKLNEKVHPNGCCDAWVKR